MQAFSSRLSERILLHGPLCVGLDPSAPTLAACGLPNSAEGAFAFGQRVLEAAEYRIAIVKPQAAFFERFGSAGWRALEEVAALARKGGVLVLLDAKRGDIDSTAAAYAEAFFSPSSPVRADAVTVHAYLGVDALKPFFDFAVREGGGVFVVVRSSNPEGQALQPTGRRWRAISVGRSPVTTSGSAEPVSARSARWWARPATMRRPRSRRCRSPIFWLPVSARRARPFRTWRDGCPRRAIGYCRAPPGRSWRKGAPRPRSARWCVGWAKRRSPASGVEPSWVWLAVEGRLRLECPSAVARVAEWQTLGT